MTWWQGRMIALDLETTAPDPEEARIVTAAVVGVGGGEPTVSKTWLADPGVEIPDEAAEVHGITTEQARAEGAPIAEVVEALQIEVFAAVAKRLPIVVFNARYDFTVLDRECTRHLPDKPGLLVPSMLDQLLVVDPLVLDKWLDRYRKGSRKLLDTCAHYGAKLDDAHDASFDALAAARLAWCIGAKGQVVRRVWDAKTGAERKACVEAWERVRGSLRYLHDFQVRQAREQAIGLAEYFREQGQLEDAESVRTEWPVIPQD